MAGALAGVVPQAAAPATSTARRKPRDAQKLYPFKDDMGREAGNVSLCCGRGHLDAMCWHWCGVIYGKVRAAEVIMANGCLFAHIFLKKAQKLNYVGRLCVITSLHLKGSTSI